jgi:hypothetical protein
MGFVNYFKTSTKVAVEQKGVQKTAGSQSGLPEIISDKKVTSSRHHSSWRGTDNSFSSAMLIPDDLKHSIIVSYISKEQHKRLWIQNFDGHLEGTMLRRTKNDYFFSPPRLADSELAQAMQALNVQVSSRNLRMGDFM